MIVEVFISQCDGRDPLGDHGVLVVGDHCGLPRVGDNLIESGAQTDLEIDLAKEESPAVAGESSAEEVGNNFLALGTKKSRGFGLSLSCDGLSTWRKGIVVTPYSTRSKAVAQYLCA